MPHLRRRADGELLELVEESGRNVVRTATLLRDLLADYPEQAGLAADVRQCEHEGDRITHDVLHRLAAAPRVNVPFDAIEAVVIASWL